MCGNNTIKLEWHIYNVSISLETVLVKKYTPCQGVVWSQYRLSGTFYVPLIFGLVLFAKVCFCLPMQFMYTMYHSQNSSFLTLLRFEESSISEVPVCNCQCNIKTMQNPTNIVDLCPWLKWARGLLLAREVTGSKPVYVGEECQNQLHSHTCLIVS